MYRRVVCCGALVAVGLVNPSHDSAQAQASARPNVLLITIDTLRADRLGSYGYADARTPVLDGLARQGVRFADATAHAPLTHPSHAAIHSGRYPGSFGIRLNGMDPLPGEAETLAERLKAAGYRTGAVIASVVLDTGSGLNQGFDLYDDEIERPVQSLMAMTELQRSGSEVTSLARAWLAKGQRPWFLWVHYYDPHLPYAAPAAHVKAAGGRPYDAEIAYVDSEIGTLLKAVDRSSTTIVVTSDHGESLGDHGEVDHGYFLYDATLRVPLIVASPAVKARVVREQVRSIDIAPTIASFAGVEWPARPDGGESLRALIDGGSRPEVPVSLAESWYPRLHFGWSELRSARVGEWKYIAAPKAELYDLRSDTAEMKNVIQDRAPVAGRLAADLQKVAASFGRREAAPATQPDAATVARLQALGYVGSFAPVTSGSGTADPKDHLKQYREYREQFNRALGLLARGRAGEAAALLRGLLEMNVRAFEAHLYLGNAYFAQGRHEAALGEYEAAALLNPSLATPHFEAAKVLAQQKKTDEALTRARTGLTLEPHSVYGLYTIGVIHQRAGQWDDAFEAFSRAVAGNGRDARARSALGGAAMRLDRLDVAQPQFEAMIALEYQLAPAHYNLGVIALRRGDRAEAARRFALALQADPAFKPAREALAKIK
jgi:choline-sulfatase